MVPGLVRSISKKNQPSILHTVQYLYTAHFILKFLYHKTVVLDSYSKKKKLRNGLKYAAFEGSMQNKLERNLNVKISLRLQKFPEILRIFI
jgi:hypothetical protein